MLQSPILFPRFLPFLLQLLLLLLLLKVRGGRQEKKKKECTRLCSRMPNLCVSTFFNPPVISLVGSALREETLRRMEQTIPTTMSTSAIPSREPTKFVFHSNPDHWRMDVSQHFCDNLHKSALFLVVIECLEGEGWRLCASNAHQDPETGKEVCKLFFTRKP